MPNQPVIILTGKTGDIILMLPAFKAMHERTGLKPRVLVSRAYAPVLEGVSYVDSVILDSDFMDIPAAMMKAREFGDPVLPKWWDDKLKPEQHEGGIILRVHGNNWSVDQSKWPNYMSSMYQRSGFTLDEMMKLPLIFDKRNKPAEEHLVSKFTANNKKPLLLLNFTGEASPFPLVPEIMRYLLPFQSRLNILRLDSFRANRIYDLLGLIEKSIGMITIDTATLHLMQATTKPYIALTRDGWSGSVPRGNCSLNIKYSVAAKRAPELAPIIESWISGKQVAVSVQSNVSAASPERPPPVEPQRHLTLPARKCWMLSRPKIPLKQVTLWGCCWSSDKQFYSRTIRVLRYCSKLFDFERILFFSFMPPPRNWEFDFLQVPETNMNGWNVFVNSIVPLAVHSDFAMSVHEDGFPIRPDLWSSQFLEYDYIGAPWADGVVGNGGFNIESRKMMTEKQKLPPSAPPYEPSDNWVCRVHRNTLISKGIKFAPVDVAVEFSTEMTGKKWPSFGFHGRRFQQEKYNLGWQLIQDSEQ